MFASWMRQSLYGDKWYSCQGKELLQHWWSSQSFFFSCHCRSDYTTSSNFPDFSCKILNTEKSKLNLESRCSSLRKHLSKSASELSCKECTGSATSDSITPFPSPQRAKSAANPSVSTVLQRTSGFLSGLKVWFYFSPQLVSNLMEIFPTPKESMGTRT